MIRKAIIFLLLTFTILISFLIPVRAGILATCEEDSHTIVSPFEPNFKYVITIVNTGDEPDLISIAPQGEPSEKWLVLGAGGFIWLDPGEVGYFAVIVEPNGAKDGEQLVLPLLISSTKDPSKVAKVTLTTTLKELGSFFSLPRNSIIQGKVYDNETKEPIANAEIKLCLWNPNWCDQTTTGEDGGYYISSLSYEYLKEIHDKYNTRGPPSLYLEVHAKGYRSYYESAIKSPKGEVLVKDIYLEKQNISLSYQLSWENSLGFGVWKAPTSKNWEYIAISTGQHNPPPLGANVTYGIYLYDLSGNLIWSQQTLEQVWGIDISYDGRYVAAGSMAPDGKLYLYDRVKDYIWTYSIGSDVREVKFSHNGRYLAMGPTGGAGSIGLFDVTTHQLLWEYDTGDWVREIAFSPDDSYVVAASSNGYLYMLNTSNGTLLWKRFHGGYVPFVLEISQDGSRILVAGKSHEVYMFDRNGNLLWTYPTDQVITDGKMNADGSIIVVGTVWGGVYCLDGEGNLLWRRVESEGIGHNAVYVTQNGRYVVLGGKGITLLDDKGTVLWQNDNGWVNYVAVSEDGSKIIAGYEEPRVVSLYTRVEGEKAVTNALVVSGIEVFGTPDLIEITDTMFQPLKPSANKGFLVHVRYINKANTSQDIIIYVQIKDEKDEVVFLGMVRVIVDAGEPAEASMGPVKGLPSGTYEVKTYIWATKTLSPLGEVGVLTLEIS